MIEKPLTLVKDEAERLNALAKKQGVNLTVGHVLLFHPAFEKIKQMLADGTLGTLQYIYSNHLNLGKIRSEEIP